MRGFVELEEAEVEEFDAEAVAVSTRKTSQLAVNLVQLLCSNYPTEETPCKLRPLFDRGLIPFENSLTIFPARSPRLASTLTASYVPHIPLLYTLLIPPPSSAIVPESQQHAPSLCLPFIQLSLERSEEIVEGNLQDA